MPNSPDSAATDDRTGLSVDARRRQESRGLQWKLIGSLAERGANLVGLFILPRLVSQADFGVIDFVNSIVLLVGMLRDIGVSQILIQAPTISPSFVSSCFWARVGSGVSLYALLAVLSYPIAAFYQKPDLPPLMLATGTIFFLDAFAAIQQSLLVRDLRVKETAIVRVASLSLGLCVAGILGYYGYGPWALASHAIVSTVASGILYFFYTRWIPTGWFRLKDVRGFVGFGAHLTGTQLLGWFTERFSIMALAKVVSEAEVGVFGRAYAIGKWPDSLLGSVFGGGLAVSIFARRQGDSVRMLDALKQLSSLLYLIGIPMGAWIIVMAEPLVRGVLGPKWGEAVPLVQIITIGGLFLMLRQTLRHWLIASGRPASLLVNQVITACVSVLFTLWGLRHGMMGVTIATTSACVVESGLLWMMNARHTGLGPWRWLVTFHRSLLVGTLVAIVLVAARPMLDQCGSYKVELALSTMLTGLTWAVSGALLARGEMRFMFSVISHWLGRGHGSRSSTGQKRLESE